MRGKHELVPIDYILGFAFWLYFSIKRLLNPKLKCPGNESGIHLFVVRGGYFCRDCGMPMGRVAPGADGVDK